MKMFKIQIQPKMAKFCYVTECPQSWCLQAVPVAVNSVGQQFGPDSAEWLCDLGRAGLSWLGSPMHQWSAVGQGQVGPGWHSSALLPRVPVLQQVACTFAPGSEQVFFSGSLRFTYHNLPLFLYRHLLYVYIVARLKRV